ncbi:hypothetical protein VKT23_016708 [Stygiomarasmius scandens]|uniref:Serpentine receptor class gamma n=1 Tax=Marasmiellus scandens TaxID=2682957 RepID=A0ABR1IU83_9AGAR
MDGDTLLWYELSSLFFAFIIVQNYTGINLLVYTLCIYVFFSRSQQSNIRTTVGLVIISTLLSVSNIPWNVTMTKKYSCRFSVATAHMGINLRRLILGYVNPETKADMTKFLLDISQPTNVAKQFMVVFAVCHMLYFSQGTKDAWISSFQNLFSDTLIIWRVFTVWQKQYLICLPVVFMALGVFVTGMASPIVEAQAIAGRIWFMTRDIRKFSKRSNNQYWRLVVLIIESASVAAVAQTLELAFYSSNFPGVYFIADSVVQIISIAPLSIIVFVGLTHEGNSNIYGTTYDQERAGKISEIEFADAHKTGSDIGSSAGKGTHIVYETSVADTVFTTPRNMKDATRVKESCN